MRSISPAKVTRPAVPPNSSMTIAIPDPRRCISESKSSAVSVSGTVKASRTTLERSAGGCPLGHPVEQVRDVEDADDVVDALAVDGQTRVPAAGRDLGDLRSRRIHRQRHHLGARHHDLSRGQIGEREDAVQHLLLFFLEHPGFLRGRHQHLQLFFRVHQRVAAGRLEPERPHDDVAKAVEHQDGDPEDPHEQLRGLGHQQRHHLGLLERYRLGRQLAEHDVKGGDDRKRQHDADGVRHADGQVVAKQRKHRLEHLGQRGLPDPAQRQTCHRDAQLRGRDVAVRVVQRPPNRARAAMSLRDQLVDACLAHRDQRELGGDEETVGEDQRQYGDQAEGDACRVHAGTVPDCRLTIADCRLRLADWRPRARRGDY